MTQRGVDKLALAAGLTALCVSAGDGVRRRRDASARRRANPATATCEAVVVSNGDLIHSGQVFPIGQDGTVIGQTAAEQVRAVLARLDKSLQSVGSGLAGLVRVTVYADSDETAAIVAAQWPDTLPQGILGRADLMAGQLPTEPKGAKLSIDAVALPLGKPASPSPKQTDPGQTDPGQIDLGSHGSTHFSAAATAKAGEFAEVSILPAGDVLFISGQAEKGATLEEATDRTLEGLAPNLEWLGLGLDDVGRNAFFRGTMEGDLNRVRERFRQGFANRPVPASTFLSGPPRRRPSKSNTWCRRKRCLLRNDSNATASPPRPERPSRF